MNPDYVDHIFPHISVRANFQEKCLTFQVLDELKGFFPQSIPLGKGLPKASPESIDLLSRTLLFNPDHRLTSIEAMTQPFFDNLKDPHAHMPNGQRLPALYNFTRHGKFSYMDYIHRATGAETM